jgi:hypothetical protein
VFFAKKGVVVFACDGRDCLIGAPCRGCGATTNGYQQARRYGASRHIHMKPEQINTSHGTVSSIADLAVFVKFAFACCA